MRWLPVLCVAIVLAGFVFAQVTTTSKPWEKTTLEKAYWAGFREGIKNECESDTHTEYSSGFTDCMNGKEKV